LRKQYSDYRAQSSSNRSVRHHRQDEEVDQPDLRAYLDRRDLRPRINNRHRERDAAEREHRHVYDKEYGVPGANCNNCDQQPRENDYQPVNDLDGFSVFSNRL